MKRAALMLLFSLICQAALGQYPIYPAMPQPMAWPAYGGYRAGTYGGYSPYGYGGYGYGGYGPYGLAGMPYGGLNWLPPTVPSPYLVAPSGRQYLEQVRRREVTTYSQLKLLNSLQK